MFCGRVEGAGCGKAEAGGSAFSEHRREFRFPLVQIVTMDLLEALAHWAAVQPDKVPLSLLSPPLNLLCPWATLWSWKTNLNKILRPKLNPFVGKSLPRVLTMCFPLSLSPPAPVACVHARARLLAQTVHTFVDGHGAVLESLTYGLLQARAAATVYAGTERGGEGNEEGNGRVRVGRVRDGLLTSTLCLSSHFSLFLSSLVSLSLSLSLVYFSLSLSRL